jgi:hypothetical protein
MHILLIFIDALDLARMIPPSILLPLPIHRLSMHWRAINAGCVARRAAVQTAPSSSPPIRASDRREATKRSGQAVILTGRNVPAEIGEHYGPKPNPAIRAVLAENNLFKELTTPRQDCRATGTPIQPPYFRGIERGKTLRSSNPASGT